MEATRLSERRSGALQPWGFFGGDDDNLVVTVEAAWKSTVKYRKWGWQTVSSARHRVKVE